MRKYSILVYLLINLSLLSVGQSTVTTEKIKIFCKVWGFLKYHHPSVATGKPDWDSVFVENIQKAMNTRNNTEFNNVLQSVINDAGKFQKTKKKYPDGLFTLNKTDIDWVTKSEIFTFGIRKQLKYINDNENHTNRYIKIVNNTSDFSGENKYDNMGFPGTKYRLLFLSRFWNIINYFAPYKYLTSNWDDVLRKFIPKIINSKDSLSYYETLQELCKSLHDGHSRITLPGGMNLTDLVFGHYTIPFYCDIIDDKVVVRNVPNDSINKTLNIQQGDIVLAIDGKDVNEIISYRKKYISSSNYADENHQLSRFILDGQIPTVTLDIQRGKKTIKTTVARVSTATRDWSAFINYTYNDVGYKMLKDSVLLIYAMQIWNGNIDTIKQMIKHSKAVIFDVRNYPQNDAFFYITDPFLSEPKVINYSTIALPGFPGFFKWELNKNKIGHISDSAYKGKVIILCDERTQSQGEYSCMALQTIPGAVTIGSNTAGADGVVTFIPLGGGVSMSYSGYGIYYPGKSQTQRVGIKIDIPVRKTIAGIKNDRDEILETALQYISKGKISK